MCSWGWEWFVTTELRKAQGSQRALALDSVTFMRDPFAANDQFNFSPDYRTRIILLAGNINLKAGETYSIVTAQAEDAQGGNYPLEVEFIGKLPGYDWLTQIVIRVPDQWNGAGDRLVMISLAGVNNNQALVTIRQ